MPSLPNDTFDHKYVYEEIGYNLKPIEIQAAIGNAQIEKLDEITRLRKRNHKLIVDIFSKYKQYFHLPEATDRSDPNWFAVALTIKDDAPFTRSEFCKFLEYRRIQTRPYFAGNIMYHPAYQGLMSEEDLDKYPIAKKITTNTFFLGCSPIVNDDQIAYIGEKVDEFFGGEVWKK